MSEKFIGYCPVQDKVYSISVEYINTSDMTQTIYCKGEPTCEYNESNDTCDPLSCPIWESAPNEL